MRHYYIVTRTTGGEDLFWGGRLRGWTRDEREAITIEFRLIAEFHACDVGGCVEERWLNEVTPCV